MIDRREALIGDRSGENQVLIERGAFERAATRSSRWSGMIVKDADHEALDRGRPRRLPPDAIP
jgi:hypothetical protein